MPTFPKIERLDRGLDRFSLIAPAIATLAVCLGLAAAPAAAEDEIRPLSVPDAMTISEIPPIDANSLVGLTPYENLRSARFADWHPSEREVMIATRFGQTVQLHEVDGPGMARRQLTFYDEPIGGGAYRPSNPNQVLFLKDEGGSENNQIFLFDKTTGVAKRLSDGVHRYINAGWSDDGELISYSSNARNGRDTDIYILDPDTGAETRLTEEEGTWAVSDWSDDGSELVVVRYLSINETILGTLDRKSGELTVLTPTDGAKAAYFGGIFSSDGKTIYTVTDRDREAMYLGTLDRETGDIKPLIADDRWGVENLDISDDGKLIAAFLNEGGISRLRLVDTASGRQLTSPDLPAGVAGGASFRPDSHELAFTISWARSPSDLYTYDAASGRLDRWTDSETGGLDASTFSIPELVHFDSFDGLEIPAFVYRPTTGKAPYPVYINIHGGPEGQFRPTFRGSDNFLLNELGIALVYPNVRGSAGYGKSYLLLDNGFKREDSVKDIGALLDWIGSQADLDSSRVMVGGGSYGGYMSLASMVFYSDRLRAGYDAVGISNFVTFLKNTQSYRRDLRRAEYGDERDPEMHDFLQEISPANRVDKITKPMLVVQGANDPRVPLSESDQVVAALRKQGIPAWYMVAADEGHGFRKKVNSDYLRAVRIEFMKRHLLGGKEGGGMTAAASE